MTPDERAAYRAMARFRITPAERARFAAEVVTMLADVPAGLLYLGAEDGVGSWGVTNELARRGLYTMPSVASVRLRDVAAAAVQAAAKSMLERGKP